MDDKQTVCLTLYCPTPHIAAITEFLTIRSADYTFLLGQGVWRGVQEATLVFHFVLCYADADWLAGQMHSLLTERGEQEVLLTINPVAIWSKS